MRALRAKQAAIVVCALLLCATQGRGIAGDIAAVAVAVYNASNVDVTDNLIAGHAYHLYGHLFISQTITGHSMIPYEWRLNGNPIDFGFLYGPFNANTTIHLHDMVPPFIPAIGTHTLTFIVDHFGWVNESSEWNNTASRTFTVQETVPEASAVFDDPNEGFVIRWNSYTNRIYAIEYSTNLLDGFTVLTNNIPATPPMNSVTVNAVDVESKYWRVTTPE